MIQMGLYEWVYVLTGIFGTYTIYKYMEVFFDVKKTSRTFELMTYTAYYFIITISYLFINIPIVLLLVNIIAFFCLTYNYESTLQKRILSVVLIYFILMIVELISVVPFGGLNFYLFIRNEYFSIFGLIVCRILSFLVALILNNFKNIKQGASVPISSWLSIIFIPATSLFITLLLFQANGLTAEQVFVGVALLFLINFATFYLYDAITAALSERMQGILVMEQNKYYTRQLEMIETSIQTVKAIRHDLINHMISIKTLIANAETDKALDYISEIMDDLGTRKGFSTSGNTVIDSIINFKFQEAERRAIKTCLDLKIPEKLNMDSFDITVILGNLLDNAIKAASKVEKGAFISLKMRYDKGRLMIQADNPYTGKINEQKGNLLTTENDRENHGYGLQNVKKVIQKYDGTVDIDYKNNLFSIALLLYLD